MTEAVVELDTHRNRQTQLSQEIFWEKNLLLGGMEFSPT